MKTFYHRHRLITWSAVTVLVLLLVARAIAPRVILRQLNDDLATLSPVYQIRIQHLHLSFVRMFYRFEGVEGWLKKSGKTFVHADRIDVSVAWSEILRGRILTNVMVDGARVILSHELLTDTKDPGAKPKETARSAADKLFPVRVSTVDLRRASIQFGDFLKEPDNDTWRVHGIQGIVSNINPTRRSPFTFFNLRGTMLQSSTVKT
jgi:hypothetical protein